MLFGEHFRFLIIYVKSLDLIVQIYAAMVLESVQTQEM